ncbi:MAG: enoyl-ACP reductase [Planctomycetota bacterium]
MGLMDDKVVAVFGIANKRSIAWGIAKQLAAHGAKLALNYQNDRMKDSIEKLVPELGQEPWMAPCDVTDEGQIDAFFAGLKEQFGHLDGMVHSIAFAKRDELGGRFRDTTRDGFQLAQDISAYSLIPLAKKSAELMEGRDGSIICLTYYGSERVVDGYNVMGVAKASLESSTRYLAADLGPDGIRVNAISAGPLKTVSAMGISGFSNILEQVEAKAPMRRNVTTDDVGKSGLFLLSDLASGVSGQVLYVDCGYSVLGV